MVPALLVTFTLGEFVGAGLQGALGLAENESLAEAGALGLLAAVFLTLLLIAPQLVGILLGIKARRRGERRLGLIGVSANALIGTFLVLTAALNLILA